MSYQLTSAVGQNQRNTDEVFPRCLDIYLCVSASQMRRMAPRIRGVMGSLVQVWGPSLFPFYAFEDVLPLTLAPDAKVAVTTKDLIVLDGR